MNANGQTQTQYCLVAYQMLPVKEGTLEVMNVICLKKVILKSKALVWLKQIEQTEGFATLFFTISCDSVLCEQCLS